MDEEELRNKNKKYYEYDNDDNNSEKEDYYLNDEDEEKIEEEYFNDTVCIIQKNLLNFIENKSLPLCEYLDLDSLDNFIVDNIEY